MKIYIILLVLLGEIFAGEYYSKIEPIDSFYIKSSVSGKVVDLKKEVEGKISKGTIIIHIDDKIDKIDLDSSKRKLALLKSNISLSKESVVYAKKSMKIDQSNYDRIKNLSTYSKIQKDAKLLTLINSKNNYLKAKNSLQNLQTQKLDLELKIATLKDKIDKKNIKIKKGLYIYKIYPNIGDFVNMGSPLVDVQDLSFAKLTIFVSSEDLKNIESKKIYLDNKLSNYKIDKVWSVADTQNISSYRVEILIDKPDRFSKLMKVEFK